MNRFQMKIKTVQFQYQQPYNSNNSTDYIKCMEIFVLKSLIALNHYILIPTIMQFEQIEI